MFPVEDTIQDMCSNTRKYSPASGYFKSPNYPLDYPTNSNCHCTLMAPAKYTFHFRLLDIRLETSLDCDLDFLEINTVGEEDNDENDSGEGVGYKRRFCRGQDRLRYVETGSATVQLHFRSDGSVQLPGVWLVYYGKDNQAYY